MATSNPADFKVKNGLVVSTTATVLSTETAVSTTTGALIVSGGVGVGKDLWVGGLIYGHLAGAGDSSTTSTNISGGTTGQIPYQSGPGLTSFFGPGTAGNVLVSGGEGTPVYQNTLTLSGTTQSSSTTTGVLIVGGGAAVGGNLNVYNTATIAGGTKIDNNRYYGFGGAAGMGMYTDGSYLKFDKGGVLNFLINNTGPYSVLPHQFGDGSGSAASPDIRSGSWPGLGVFFPANGQLGIAAGSTRPALFRAAGTASTSTTTGALVVDGGMGVNGSVYVSNRVGFVGTTTASAVYQFYNTATNSLDTVFG